MPEGVIYITKSDQARLQALLDSVWSVRERDRPYLDSLREEINRAQAVSAEQLPRGVVRMHSRVRLKDLDSGKENVYTLVFPAEADIAQSRISVLAPLGTALLGYRQGDVIRWKVPGGWRRWKVKEVLDQPAGRVAGSAASAIQASSLRRSRATVREAA